MGVLFCLNLSAHSNEIQIVTDNKTNYKIIISKLASQWDSLAAKELQKYIFEISNAEIPIENEFASPSNFEIVIGKSNRSAKIDVSQIQYDGFIIQSEGNKLFLLGGEEKSTLNAVYTFLEKFLGCRMYSSTVKKIPKQNSIILQAISLQENPVFNYREVHYSEAFNNEYSHWHKLVNREDKNIWGMFVHTFQTLMPAEKYFTEHPEYFALRGNIRVPEEPCLSNPEVYKIMSAELRKRIQEKPDALIWSVSQNDNDAYCQCNECRKIDEYEGSPSGSIINFVNKFAREFPDKIISTLAYRYSRKAPKFVKPEKNVNIMLCTIECFRTKPIEDDSSNSSFVDDLSAWSKITNDIFLWDYVVQFSNFISPFPNFQVLQPNIKLFAKYGVKMMFQQGSGRTSGTEFGELRTYLISKLLWNPNINFDSIMNDFLNGFYDAAGKYLKEYIVLMQNELISSNHNLWIYSNPIEQMNSFLRPDLIDKYNEILDKAEQSVINLPEVLERVKIARTPLMYAMLEQSKILNDSKRGMFIKISENNYEVNASIKSLLDEFLYYSTKTKNVLVNEKGLTPQKYVERYKSILAKSMKNPLGIRKPVKFITLPNWKYPANGEKSLTDGIRGDEDHFINWVGFEGIDMEVIIDLKQEINVKKVSADFLQNVFSWIFLPEKFEVSVSLDGNVFQPAASKINTTPVTKEELESPIFAFIKNFSCELENVETRYIKVKAVNIKICPRWHPGYPYKSWIFTDEIVIE